MKREEVEATVDIDEVAGRATPHTAEAYTCWQAARSPGCEWLRDRARTVRLTGRLIEWLVGHGMGRFPDLRLLDIGSRDGWLLQLLVNCGFGRHKLVGLELSPLAARHARSMARNVLEGDAHDLSGWRAGAFNVVTAWHVLEHCPRPLVVLRGIRRVLAEWGVLMLVVPIEPKGLSIAGGHCYAMRSDEAVCELMVESGFKVLDSARFRSDFIAFAELR